MLCAGAAAQAGRNLTSCAALALSGEQHGAAVPGGELTARNRSSCSLGEGARPASWLRSLAGDRTLAARLLVSVPSTCSQILSAFPFHEQTLVSQPSLSEPCNPGGRRIFLPHGRAWEASRCSPYLPRTHVAWLFLLPQPSPPCTESPVGPLAGETVLCQRQEGCRQALSQATAHSSTGLFVPSVFH